MQSARGFEYGVRHIISPQSGLVSDVLFSILSLNLEESLTLIDLGAIYLEHKRLHHNATISEGDYLRAHTKPRRFLGKEESWPERVFFSNDDFLVVNKLSGIPVHATVDNIRENIQAYLEKSLQLTLFLTHRLDVPTRGLLVYGKNREFQSSFNNLLIDRSLRKIYRARVQGQSLKVGPLIHFMQPSPRAPKVISREKLPGWQECRLEILEVNPLPENQSELLIELHTGRTHQIRAQLSYEGSPIVGDHAYGAMKISEEEAIELEACELSFTNPLSGAHHHFKI